MNLYFDTCALNRLNDDQTQPRVFAEATAVIRLLDLVASQEVGWVASTVLRYELERNPDAIRRLDTLAVLTSATEESAPTPAVLLRSRELAREGFRGLDALHLALAEYARADWLVTTDDRFLKSGSRRVGTLLPQLVNPVDLIQRRFPWLVPKL